MTSADLFDGVRDFIRKELAQRPVPSIAVAVVRDGGIVWEEGFDWADLENQVPAGPRTAYSLASISKPITATGLMAMAQSGQIDLDRPVNDYLGAAKLTARMGDGRKATVRTVADHSSGLPLHYQFFYDDDPWRRPPMDETIRRYGNLVTPPGERFAYSNLGYGVLDHVMSRQSGEDFAAYMRREVFQPLGMTHSSVGIAPETRPFVATRYGVDGEPIPYYGTDHPGASEVWGSVHDLALFALFHLKARLADQTPILSDASIDAMHRGTSKAGPDAAYGLGFFVETLNGHHRVSHSGGMGGVATLLQIFPDLGIATAVAANASNSLPFEVSERIVAAMVPDWPIAPVVTPVRAPPFAPPPVLVGTWIGTLTTYARTLPVELTIRPDGEVEARFGEQATRQVKHARIEDGAFRGEFRATIGTDDTERYVPYYTQLSLRNGPEGLTGVATAIGDDGPRVRNALSHWLELRPRS